MLISFEGIDGSGKSTQISLLKEKLLSLGKRVQVFREPGGTPVSENIRDLLLNSDLKIHPVTELLLFSSARAQLVAEKVIPALEKGEIVILDRYFDSTTAYQGYGRKSLPILQIQQINQIASHNKAPDFTFYLRLELEESVRRTAHQEKDRMERSGDVFFQEVIEGFDSLAKQEERVITIDASQDPSQVHSQIIQALQISL